MIYKQFGDKKLSALGLGAMRFPVIDNDEANIDLEKTAEMVDYAMANGINYYDTAWGYHMGNSEPVMGELMKKYPRDSYYIASKFPGYDLANMDKVEEIFEKQLERTGFGYFDFYLFHNVCEENIDHYLDKKYGIFEYLMKQKENGRIKHLGFSAHGDYDVMTKFLNAYGEHMEFCQLQINYLDWDFQKAKEKAELVASYGIPLWVMEPVRGGKLASLDETHEAKLKALRPEETIPAWAFRFLQTIPNITVVLSGMSNMDQLAQNIETYAEEKPLNAEEMEVLLGIATEMTGKIALPCTACRYCETKCPKGLTISELLAIYNEDYISGDGTKTTLTLRALPEDKIPGICIGCKNCEAVCPQHIKISEALANLATKM